VSDEQKEKMDLFGAAPQEAPHADSGAKPDGAASAGDGTARGEKAHDAADEKPASLKTEETVGEILLAARERQGQTLEFMSQETKIPKQMLQYLETDNYEALPAKVYARSFLRTYTESLGLDVQHILGKYEFQTGQTHRSKGDHWEVETEIVEEKLQSPFALKRYIIPAIIAIIAILLIVKLAGGAGGSREKVEVPQQVGLTEEILNPKPAAVAEPKSRETEPADSERALEPMELVISANPTDSCWFELVLVDIVGDQPERTTHQFTLPPGATRSFQATEEFIFKKVGNAGGFVMDLNDSRLPTLGKRGKVITDYIITRENLPKGKKNDR